jgi:class 3 adenylate cyclase/tetratricopeptide (TPR) repeat protein
MKEDEQVGAAAPAPDTALSEAARQEIERFRIAHETRVLTILFTDLVGSTRLQDELGNVRAADLIRAHRAIVRAAVANVDGREVETAGDSFLIVFAAPSEAVKFALELQARTREGRTTEPMLPEVRVGIHQGQVAIEEHVGGAKPVDIYGLQVSTAARIMDLARGGQILCSRAVFDDARAILRGAEIRGARPLAWRNHGLYRFKGVEDTHEVCEVGEEGFAPLAAPGATAKSWPADESREELGWRPAVGVRVPSSSWTLTEKLGEGEFGEVWKAFNPEDKSYQVYKFCFRRDRLPALKREARLLKRLRKHAHPNLVEVYDVTEGDRPPHYLEMEHVDGPSMKVWLAGAPPLSDRLEIVAQVADALDTVHAAGIYHRDIKPANILLGRREDGALRAKLTDFGLGAAEDEDLLRSIQASKATGVAGTWDYIAPEIREGRGASPQSDLYSLGLTLYQIVVGDLSRPLTADWEDQVPSEVLRGDIRRCVARDPASRWRSASELATALRGHDRRLRELELEREQERLHARARKLRRAVAAVAAFLAFALVLGGFAAFQWREAVHQRDRAVAQKRLALEAATQLTHEVPARLRDIPGTLPALRRLVEENLGILDRILALEPDTPLARRERGVNLISTGDLWMLLGDTDKARSAYDASLSIFRGLLDSDPSNGVFERDVSISLDRLGNVHAAMGRTAEALEFYREAMEVTERLAARRPDDPAARRDVWFALDQLGGVYMKLGRTADAHNVYERAMAVARELAAARPEDEGAQRDLSLLHERMGDVNLAMGKLEAALESYEAGQVVGRRRAEAHPESREARRDLSIGDDKLGGVYLRLGRADDALAAYTRGLEVSRRLAAEEPENAEAQRDLSVSINRVADLRMSRGSYAEALKDYEEGLAIARRLSASNPRNAPARLDVAVGLVKVGNAKISLARTEDARTDYRDAYDLLAALTSEDPGNAEFQRALSVSAGKLGSALVSLGRTEEAMKPFATALDVAQRLAAKDPENIEARRDVAVCSYRLLVVRRALGQVEEFQAAADAAVAGFEKVYDLAREDPRSRRDLVMVLHAAASGAMLIAEPKPEVLKTALERARRAVELAEKPDPEHLETLALAQFLSGDAAGAIESLEKGIALLPPEPGDESKKELRSRMERSLASYRETRSK